MNWRRGVTRLCLALWGAWVLLLCGGVLVRLKHGPVYTPDTPTLEKMVEQRMRQELKSVSSGPRVTPDGRSRGKRIVDYYRAWKSRRAHLLRVMPKPEPPPARWHLDPPLSTSEIAFLAIAIPIPGVLLLVGRWVAAGFSPAATVARRDA